MTQGRLSEIEGALAACEPGPVVEMAKELLAGLCELTDTHRGALQDLQAKVAFLAHRIGRLEEDAGEGVA